MRGIRPVALAVLRRGDEVLVFAGEDRVKGETFHRLLGGGVEFGETSEDALRREMREELAVEIEDVELLRVVENLFTYAGEQAHEIVFLFSATVVDAGFYSRDDLTILDEGSPVFWLPLAEVRAGRAILYPTGVLDVLQ